MENYKCNMALVCKSETCSHAKDHDHRTCNCAKRAPCGSWPDNPDYQPMVQCIPSQFVVPTPDCPHCGMKESKGHHYMDCINNLKNEIKSLTHALTTERAKNSASGYAG